MNPDLFAMRRCWDIFVGAFMIVASLAVQAVVIFVFLGLLCGALANQFGWKEGWLASPSRPDQ